MFKVEMEWILSLFIWR